MKAIETSYRGVRFRSRQEARWAVFLDTLAIPFQYEAEGFELSGGIRYLPDFWLPTLQCYLEIKGARPTVLEIQKVRRLAAESARQVFIFSAEWSERDGAPRARRYGAEYAGAHSHPWGWLWNECPFCGLIDICPLGFIAFCRCACGSIKGRAPAPVGMETGHTTTRLLAAYEAMKSARFERFPKDQGS